MDRGLRDGTNQASSRRREKDDAADGQEEIGDDAADVADEHRPWSRGNGGENHSSHGPEHEFIELSADGLGEDAMSEVVNQQSGQEEDDLNCHDDGRGVIEEVGQKEGDGEEEPEMEADAHAEPGAERHGEPEESGGIAKVIARSAASIVIAILPGQIDPFAESSRGL